MLSGCRLPAGRLISRERVRGARSVGAAALRKAYKRTTGEESDSDVIIDSSDDELRTTKEQQMGPIDDRHGYIGSKGVMMLQFSNDAHDTQVRSQGRDGHHPSSSAYPNGRGMESGAAASSGSGERCQGRKNGDLAPAGGGSSGELRLALYSHKQIICADD